MAPHPRALRYLKAALLACLLFPFSPDLSLSDEPIPLTYRQKWLFNVSTTGDLVARGRGYFAESGLAVTLKEGGPERDAIKELELGLADFGVASADQVIRALSKGSPVRVVAQLFQVNPLQWMYRPERTGLDRLADLRGKTVGVTFGGNDETIMRTLLARAGIRDREVRLFSVRYDYTPFYRGEVDIWPVYRNAQGVFIGEKLRREGEAVAFFNPADHGVRFVANSVVTSAATLEQRPEVVRKFTSALLRGWREALRSENEEEVLRILAGYDRDTEPELLREQLRIPRGLIQPDPAVPVGRIDLPAWRETEAIMVALGQIPEPVGVDRHLREGWD